MKLSLFSLVFGIMVTSLIGFSSVPAFANDDNDVLPFSNAAIITGSSTTSTVLSFSSSVIISTSSTTTTAGTTVTLDFYEINDGTVPLFEPSVSSDSSLCSPVYSSGDSNVDGILDSGEVWHFTCDVLSYIPDIYVIELIGFGIDSDDNEITWPGDLEERIVATIEVTETETGTNDHYMSYKAKEHKEPKHPKESKHSKKSKHSDKFEVALDDQFESATYTVEKTDRLYNPVQKTHDGIITGITDFESHYVGYKIKTPKGEPKFDKVTDVLVTNQFGDIIVDVKKAKLLLVPSAKNHDTTPDVLNPVRVDHYKCYDAKETKHTPKFEKRVVSLYDPNFEITQDFEIKKPKYLCTPVQKTHDGITTPITDDENHLLCYDVKKLKDAPKFEKRNVFTNNQFGSEKLKVEKQEELCVPSIKTLL